METGKKEKNQMMRKILVLIFAVILLGGSTIAFSWWDSLTVNRLEQDIVTVGQGLELVVLDVEIDPLTDGSLVPADAILKTGDTHEVVLEYTVRIAEPLDAALDLEVTVSNIEVDSVANPYGLISVVVTNPGTIQNSDVIVSLSVTIDDSLLDAEDYDAAYLALAGNSITFEISFEVTEA
ncbi:MAG: hypothetical protein PHC46_00155 [Clostridia bacterium]|nr:hypothetical protein [Clostridia bacterium]